MKCQAKHYGPERAPVTLVACENDAVYNFEGIAVCEGCAGEAAEGGEAMLGVNLWTLTQVPVADRTPDDT